MYLILLCFGTLFGLGAFFLLAGLLRLPTSASTKAVLTVTNRGKAKKNSMNAILFDMAAKAAPLVRMDAYKRRKLEAQLKSAEIQMSPETYVAAAWVKGGLISVKRGDNGIMYFQMLSMTFKQLELQKLKLEAMKQPGKMRKYSFMLLGCFLLMYLGVLGYVVLEAFGDLF